jgi:hypothetical protein
LRAAQILKCSTTKSTKVQDKNIRILRVLRDLRGDQFNITLFIPACPQESLKTFLESERVIFQLPGSVKLALIRATMESLALSMDRVSAPI